MQICKTKSDVRAAAAALRKSDAPLGFVPTMGFLHDGHLSLIRGAKARCGGVVVSIFVNPTQFGDAADLANYPRNTDADLALLHAAGVDVVFLPEVDEMYPAGAQTIVETTDLADVLMGALRPGHFRGVATIVTKLFNIVQPDHVFFGEKDYQQLAVIRTLVRDLDMPITVNGMPTVREADGLAMSSRNVRLTPDHRASAVALCAALDWAEATLVRDQMTAEELQSAVVARLSDTPGAEIQSVDVRDALSLAALSGPLTAPAVILLAVRFGAVLLIDQRVVTP